MSGPKYRIDLKGGKKVACRPVYPIVALKDFKIRNGEIVCKGMRGGYVESEANLSQDGACWVGPGAAVIGDAMVCEDALVYGDTTVYNGSMVRGRAIVDGESRLCKGAVVEDSASVRDAVIEQWAVVSKAAAVCDSCIGHHATISGHASVRGGMVGNGATVTGHAKVNGGIVKRKAVVDGDTMLEGERGV